MRQTKLQIGIRALMVLAAGALLLLVPPPSVRAASATALVSATVLGPAETEIASGAVTLSKISESGGVQITRPGEVRDLRALSTFRIAGGFHATYAVALPDTVSVKGESGEFAISGFRASGRIGRLASDGTATFEIKATVSVPAQQPAGIYTGTYPVTIVYD